MSRKKCDFCGEKLPSGLRSGAKFCTPKCRKSASRERLKVERQKQSRTLNEDERKVVQRIANLSPRTAKNLLKMLSTFGKDYHFFALNTVSDLLHDLGYEVEYDAKTE